MLTACNITIFDRKFSTGHFSIKIYASVWLETVHFDYELHTLEVAGKLYNLGEWVENPHLPKKTKGWFKTDVTNLCVVLHWRLCIEPSM